jgi:hypothetical protein
MTEFADLARATLLAAGVRIDEDDLQVLGMVAQAFGPAMNALDGADLRELPLEPDLDPASPPRRGSPESEAR